MTAVEWYLQSKGWASVWHDIDVLCMASPSGTLTAWVDHERAIIANRQRAAPHKFGTRVEIDGDDWQDQIDAAIEYETNGLVPQGIYHDDGREVLDDP